MTPDPRAFEQQVGEALASVEHDKHCGEDSYGACDCSREQRIAQRVVAAIEAAASWQEYPWHPWVDHRRDAALSALQGKGDTT